MYGALVEFSGGGKVSRVRTSSDFSAARLEGLPPASKPQNVYDLLLKVGITIDLEDIRIIPTNYSTTTALITVEDPAFAARLCQRLKNYLEGDGGTACLKASSTSPRLPPWAGGRRVSCRKVIVSCRIPTRYFWLNFGDFSVAKRVCNKFNEGKYCINGHVVKADPPTGASRQFNRAGVTVLLREVPSCVTKQEVQNSIQASYDSPRLVEMDKSVAICDDAAVPVFIESLLRQFGPVEITHTPRSTNQRLKMMAYFEDEDDARKAHSSLCNQPQTFLNGGVLYADLISSAKLKVSKRIYESVKDEIATHLLESRDGRLRFHEYTMLGSQAQLTSLKVDGQDAGAVAAAINKIEDILAGQVIYDGQSKYWTASLDSNSESLQALHHIGLMHAVTFTRDRTKKEVRYHGPSAKMPHMQATVIEDLLKIDASSTARPRSPTAIRRGENMRDAGDKCPDCPICLSPPENGVILECGHQYCLDCFEGLCSSAELGTGELSVICLGNSGSCHTAISFRDLHTHLTSLALESLLERSFNSYIRRRPLELKYCTTPDCEYVYRASDQPRNLTCRGCLQATCTSCHQQHGIMTCGEYRDIKSEGLEAFERYKKEMNVKDCPKCSTCIEKTDGCNHMTCSGCGIHMYWICLNTFDTSRPVYQHMNAAHGGIGIT